MRPDGYSFCILAGGRRPRKLAQLIETIHAQDLPRYEIIVAGAAEIEGVKYISLPDYAADGRTCHLRNAAAQHSTLEWIVFIDDDIVLTRKWCAALCNHYSPGDMVGTRLLNLDGTRHWDWASTGGPRGQILLDYGEVDPHHYLTGGLLVVRAEVWEAVRWNEALRYRQKEDVVYSRDAYKRGFTSSFCCGAIAIHNDETYTQVGRRVPRRSPEGARIWMAGSLLPASVEYLVARSEEERRRSRIPEAADCLRLAIHKSPDCVEAQDGLAALELAYGGPVDSGSWQPSPAI
ncbi:MAG: glycosyltransferase family 2 protein [Terriglobia bacterium]